MITIIDLKAELAKLRMLHGRTPEMTRAEREGSAAWLAPYRDGGIFASKSAGKGSWERHPNGDELVQIVDGEGACISSVRMGRNSSRSVPACSRSFRRARGTASIARMD